MSFADGMWQSSEWLSILFALWLRSIIILTATALLIRKLRAASAKFRHILLCSALSSLLALPLFSNVLQPFRLPVLPAGLFENELATRQPSRDPALELQRQSSDIVAAHFGVQATHDRIVGEAASSFSWQSIILLVWLTGVLLVIVRFLLGVFTVRRLIARANELTGTSWSELSSELLRELRLKRKVRLLRSDQSIMPMTCGGLSAVVVLPDEAERWPADRRRVVVLHELIHIKRGDLLTQTLAQVVCALYWFNPLVWWAVRRLRVEQEWACDERVLAAGVTAPDYAAHLLEIARNFQADAMSLVTTTAIARPSHLQKRLCAILKSSDKRYRSGPVIVTAVLVLGTVFMATASTQLVTANGEKGTEVSNVTTDAMLPEQHEGEMPSFELSTAIGALATADPKDDRILQQIASPTPANQTADLPPALTNVSTATDSPLEAQAYDDFSAEEWNQLARQGIGPAYIKEMAEAGYRGLTVSQLIGLFSNSVRADYVAGLRSVGYSGLSTNELLSLKTNGVTREVIRAYQAETRASFKAKHYPAMLSNGVTPSYVRSLTDAGYDSVSANEIIAMRLAGVTSDFIREVRSKGYTNLSPQEIIELKRSERH